ncbi:MAG: tandem-95 repeat protein, partial [Prolixibacteraceae bacterium]
MKKLIITISLLVICSAAFAQLITPFSIRKQVTQRGGILFLSNTSSKAVPDNVVQNEMPPAGTGYDNNYTNGYVDIDGDASTFMSSSDQLSIASYFSTCSEVTWAGLFWGADCSSGENNFATRNQVKLKANSGSYVDLTADYLKDNTSGFKTYHCFKDITSFIKTNGITSRYTVANVATHIGGKNLFGGWTIVIVYKDNRQTMKNLTVFDGLANVMAGTYSTVDIPISGFQTPLSGPVNFELGMVTYDGDRSLTNDKLQFKGASSFVDIYDGLHALGDIFNSTIARNGVLTPNRNPSYNNNLGYDASIFAPNNSAKNYIGNNAVSATIRQTTAGETYLTQVVTSAIDVYEPDIRSAVRVTNITHPAQATANPGDILEYTVVGMNIGSDPSIKTFVTDTIEGNAAFVPGSINITYGPAAILGAKTDGAGDDQAEYIASSKVVRVRIGTGANGFTGGTVNNSATGLDSTVFKFRVQATTDCVYLKCDPIINNSSYIVGTGNISGNTFNNASNPGVFDFAGCAIPGSTSTSIVTAGCPTYNVTGSSPVCQGNTISFTNDYVSPSATFVWSGPNGFSSTLREPTVTNATVAKAGVYTANVYITGTNCHFVHTVNVVVTAADAGADQTGSTTCGRTTVTLAGNTITDGGLWSVQSGPVGYSFSNTSSPTSTFTGSAGASYTLRWSANGGSCPSTFDEVNIRFNRAPTASVLSGTTSICYNGYANLKATITGGTAPYTVVLNNGGGTFSNYTSGSDMVVGPITSTTTYSIVSVTDANGCTSAGLSGSAVVTVSGSITGTGTITQPSGGSGSVGHNFAGTAASSGSNYSWSNPNNAKANEPNSWTTQTITGKSSPAYLNLTKFFTTIPTNSTINGIEVIVDRHYTTTGNRTIRDKYIYLIKAGTAVGNNKALSSTNWPLTNDATVTYGSPTDLWGSTWLPSDINATDFGVAIRTQRSGSSGDPTAYVDYATIKVYYSSSYCDDASGQIFSVSGYTNATTYTWTPPTGGKVTAGQGTASATMDFNGAGQSGNYSVSVAASNTCQTLTAISTTIPITNCVNATKYIKGNVYWDKNAMTDNLVNGTGVGTANGTPLYVTLEASAGTTALQNSVAVGTDGTYQFVVSASTAYKVVLSKNSYTTGQTVGTPALPSGCSYTGEIVNNITNTTTGSTAPTDGILYATSLASDNLINVNFGIKISTPPVANNDVTSTNEDTPVTYNVTTNDTDVDGTVTASTVDLDPSTAGIQTTFSNTFGNWSVISSGVVTYTPAANFNGSASVTYTVNDNDSPANTSNVGTLLVTVNEVNDPPVAVNDAITTLEDTPVTINVTTNDYDVDGTVDVTTVDLDPSTSGIQTTKTVTNQGTYTVNSSGIVTFTPVLNYNGTATPITYTVKDNNGLVSATATLTVTVTSVIDPPIAANDNATTNQNTSVLTNVTTNDIGVDAAVNVATVDLDPLTTGIQTSFTVAGEGSYSVNSSGIVTFNPLNTFYGVTTPISYTVNDANGNTSNSATYTVTVIASGAPVANDNSATTNENVAVTFNVTSNDVASAGRTINASRVDLDPLTPGIQQSWYVSGKGQFTVDMNGDVTFSPDWNYFGTATAQYTVKDNQNFVSNVANITVTINWVNAAPFAVDDAATTNEDTPVTFSVTANDYDVDGSINVATVDLDLSIAGRQTTYTVTGEGTYTVDNSGNVTFTPVLNFNGICTPINYSVNDNNGLTSDVVVPAAIMVTVNSVNDLPIAVNDAVTAPSNTDVVFNITSNDTDVDGTIDPSTVDLDPSFGGIQKTFSVAGEGTYTVDNSGNLTFSPVSSFVGPVTTTPIYYTVKDNSGGTSIISGSTYGKVTITLANPDAPEAVDDVGSMNEDGSPITIDILANDIAGSGNIVDATVDLDPLTTGKQTSKTVTGKGTFTVDATGIVTFTPVANFNGVVEIMYNVYDDNSTPLLSNNANITVTVNPVNDPPVISNFTLNGFEDITLAFTPENFTTNYSDVESTPLNSVKITSLPSNGTLKLYSSGVNSAVTLNQVIASADLGNLTFVPTANWNGSTSFNWNATDGTAYAAADRTVTMVMAAVNDAPSFTAGSNQTICKNTGAQSISGWATSLSKGPSDESGQTLSFTVTNDNNTLFSAQPAIGSTGTLTYTPASNQTGTATVSVKIKDNGGTANNGVDESAIQTFTITVSPTSVGGSISGGTTVCSGTNSTALTLSGHTGSVSKWQSATTSGFTGTVTDIANTTTSLTATNLTATTYYRAVVTSGACSSVNSATATITVSPTSVGGSISGSTTVCSGTNSTTLTLSGNTGSVTKWQSALASDFTGTVTDIANTTTSLTATNLTSTTYYRAVVTSGACSSANSSTGTVTVNSISAGTIGSDQSQIPGGNPAAFTVTVPASGAGALTYQWQSSTTSSSSGFSDISLATSSTYDAPSGIAVTTYYKRIVTSTLNLVVCTAESNVLTVTVGACVDPSITGQPSSPSSVCNGSGTATFTLTALGSALNYAWQEYNGSGWSALTDGGIYSGVNTATLTLTNPTTSINGYKYKCTVNGACGSPQTSDGNATVTVNPVLSGNSSGSVVSICNSNSTTLTGGTVTGGSGSYTYLWESSDAVGGTYAAATGTNNAANYTTATLTTASTAVYFRRTVTSGGCTNVATPVKVTVNPLPAPTLYSAGSTTFCQGNSATLNVSGNALTFGSNSRVEIADNANLRFTSAQSYTLMAWVYVASNTNTWRGIVTKSRDQESFYGIWIDPSNNWIYGSGYLPTDSYYNISGPSVTTGWHHIAIVQTGSVQRELFVDGVSAGTGTAQNAVGTGMLRFGQSGDNFEKFDGGILDEVSIFNTNLSSATINTWKNTSITNAHPNYASLVGYWKLDEGTGSATTADAGTNGYTGTLVNSPVWVATTAPVNQFSSYLWSPGSATTSTLNVTASGSYSVFVTDANGCSNTTSSKTITVNPLPVPTISGSTTVCINSTGNVYTTESGMTAYSWSIVGGTITAGGTATDNTATVTWTVSGAKSISVNYTNGNSCTAASSTVYNVTVNPVIATNTISAAQVICTGSTPSALTGSTPTGGSGTYVYLWESSTTSSSAGFTTASGTSDGKDYTPGSLTATTWYRRTVTSGGCSSTATAIEITVSPVIATNTISSAQVICTGSTPSALTGSTPTGGSGTYVYLWESSTTSSSAGFTT